VTPLLWSVFFAGATLVLAGGRATWNLPVLAGGAFMLGAVIAAAV